MNSPHPSHGARAVPLIDLAVPADLRTATFALG